MRLFPYKYNRSLKNKYYLSVLAIFRNETHVLREWLDHYLMLGIEHFYLIDNNSDDDVIGTIGEYIKSGVVELYFCEPDGFQIGAYSELLPKIAEETSWIGVFDLDEFIYPCQGGALKEIVERFSANDAILIPWLSFGSSGHIEQPASVIEHFLKRGEAGVSRSFLKSITKPKEITYFSQHNPITRNKKKILSSGEEIGDSLYISLTEDKLPEFSLINNHYRLQSFQYFKNVKTSRPEVNEEVKGRVKKMDFFIENDKMWNTVADSRLADLKAALTQAQLIDRRND